MFALGLPIRIYSDSPSAIHICCRFYIDTFFMMQQNYCSHDNILHMSWIHFKVCKTTAAEVLNFEIG